MANIYTSITSLIGKTPLLRLTGIEKEYGLKAKLVAKLELFNATGSSKGRVALKMIEDYEKSGLINKDTTLIEPTSGNTGIGLAGVCASRGYKLIIVMPDNYSSERIKLIKCYGAEVVLTNGSLGMKGAIDKANELNKTIKNSIICSQFTNPSNPKAHYETTAVEIFNDTDGQVDVFVASVGTGGTITGVGEYLKQNVKNVKVVAVEPESSPLLTRGISGSHKIQGIGANFIPSILNTSIYDEVLLVTDENAYLGAKLLAQKDGVLAGISSGAVLSAGIELAKREENNGKTIVLLLADTGERYLSDELF